MRSLARSLTRAKFQHQLGPFALVRRPEKEVIGDTWKMGLPAGAQHTSMARPEDIERGILSLIFEFDELEISTLPPLTGEDELSVGRLPDCDLVIDHRSVSKRHAAFRWDGKQGKCTVKDLGSTNGTYLNDSAIGQREVALRDGDIVSFGEVQFWFLLTATLHDKLNGSRASWG